VWWTTNRRTAKYDGGLLARGLHLLQQATEAEGLTGKKAEKSIL